MNNNLCVLQKEYETLEDMLSAMYQLWTMDGMKDRPFMPAIQSWTWNLRNILPPMPKWASRSLSSAHISIMHWSRKSSSPSHTWTVSTFSSGLSSSITASRLLPAERKTRNSLMTWKRRWRLSIRRPSTRITATTLWTSAAK